MVGTALVRPIVIPTPIDQAALRARMMATLAPGLPALIDHIGDRAARFGLAVYLVGGAVRDILLGTPTVDLDFVIAGESHSFAQSFAGEGLVHLDRFGTAHWQPDAALLQSFGMRDAEFAGFAVDFAMARAESYEHPGALPTVDPTPTTIETDLLRRDFSINALALRVPDLILVDVTGGLTDLESGVIRALHRLSFRDDPTRIFRAARYAARFGFRLDDSTNDLIDPALPVIGAISGHRIQRELQRILEERDPEKALLLLERWGVLRAVHADLHIDSWTVSVLRAFDWWQAHNTSGVGADGGWAVLLCRSTDLKTIAKRLDFSAELLSPIEQVQRAYERLITLDYTPTPSVATRLIEPLSNVGAVWAALPFAWQRFLIEAYHADWRHVFPTFTGDDLKKFGLPPGPLFGKILSKLRDLRLDGALHSVEEERALVTRWIAEGFPT